MKDMIFFSYERVVLNIVLDYIDMKIDFLKNNYFRGENLNFGVILSFWISRVIKLEKLKIDLCLKFRCRCA